MTPYTPEAQSAFAQADWDYTRRWHKAMRAFDRAPLNGAAAAYNTIMVPAHRQWKADYAAAVELGEDVF